MKNQNSTKSLKSYHRLGQILHILRKYHINKGINPVKFRKILEDLGPTFVKIGQIMSSRQDMFSKRYCQELVKLRDNVSPMSENIVRSVIEMEYGKKVEDVFASFDFRPLGSASIAQVHCAKLRDGQEIVVKVQRPHIYEMMERDILLIKKASKLLRINDILGSVVDINIILDEFWQTAKEEMDFLNEAKYSQRFAQLHKDIRYIASPRIYEEYTTKKVLVMEYIGGYDIDNVDILEKQGYDCSEIAIKLAENYIKQIVDDGFFHADPHPGNLRIRNGKIVWIDFGMMGILNRQDKDLMKNAVYAIGTNNVQQLVETILTLGVHDNRVDYSAFYNDMDVFMHRYIEMDLKDINLGDAMQEIFVIAHKHHIAMPKGISMLARGLVTIESTVMTIDPEINILQIAANHVANRAFDTKAFQKELSSSGKKIYDAASYTLDLPIKVNEVIEMIKKGRLKVNLEIMDSSVPLATVDHMINKLVVGVISAGLLMASSILCTTQMTPQLFGIPAIGFVGYLTAVCLGIWLFITVIKDRKKK